MSTRNNAWRSRTMAQRRQRAADAREARLDRQAALETQDFIDRANGRGRYAPAAIAERQRTKDGLIANIESDRERRRAERNAPFVRITEEEARIINAEMNNEVRA